MINVCPSSNPIDENNLLEFANNLVDLGVECLHADVMDGDFVPNKCLEYSVLENVSKNCGIGLDVHLMVSNSWAYVKQFANLNPEIITIHYESPENLKTFNKIFKFLKSRNILCGIAIKPNTPVKMLEQFIDDIDLILIMSVEPGKSGQKFIGSSIDKIKEARQLIGNRDIILEVDGGICLDNYKSVIDAGANFLVMGSAFAKSKDKTILLNTIDKHYKLPRIETKTKKNVNKK